MADNTINFIELVALSRIGPDSSVEKFGSVINSSFVDAANVLATMKQKGLIDFVTSFPSQSMLKITEQGMQIISEANQKATEQPDALDNAILTQLLKGKRGLADLNSSVNVTQKDLAMHLYKLSSQQYMSYELANGAMSIYLTEKGFMLANAQPQQPAATQPPLQAQGQTAQMPQKDPEKELRDIQLMVGKKNKRKMIIVLLIVAFIIVLLVLFLKK